ncbi:glycerophosphodiester phosphodiesterase GDPDL6-like isoform X2 [Malania oleifera]|nr:glycerophosphodiester phosphodiesterase GDPDL6-like isoform X2 [Malania oleifera]XP_057959797.1 glycerophosphodiester phosphodiesterase GDPDL6-like isoform X2 [Malania oleifera]
MITRCLLLVSLLIHSTLALKDSRAASSPWQTLNGDEPIVIARGGLSGVFPESSSLANELTKTLSLAGTALYCDLQLSKDGEGFCQSAIRLENSTTIADVYPKGSRRYNVNGQDMQGWFALDFTSDQLFNQVTLVQSIYSRTSLFDGTMPPTTVGDAAGVKPDKFWLNVEYDMFYTQHKLSTALFLQKAQRYMLMDFLSSPEIGFLRNMNGKVNKARTKLIFKFLQKDDAEPTTNQTYGLLLKNLASIKSFASGILVPKEFIWPVNNGLYLETSTALVTDAHKQGLEVYAYGFANDLPASYNYSYDPTAEYLQFVGNSQFSVDGVLSDFSPTASEAIGCLAHNKNATRLKKWNVLVISHNGASGVFAASTDLAYQQAVDDGADIIDCSVQMSQDGVPFCLSSPDVLASASAIAFMARSATIPEIQQNSGIFSFNLKSSEIQTLTPQLTSPIPNSNLQRNPAYKNKGKFWTFAEFLDFAKAKAVPGILINIENAAYLASKKGLSVTDAVTKALSNATFDKQSTQKVLIQSDDTSVLSVFKNVSSYRRVLSIKEAISDAPKRPVEMIKQYADAVTLSRNSLVETSNSFTSANTTVTKEMHAANISVYVSVLRNEFVTLAMDYFSDPLVELATLIQGLQVDGVVTEYPATANAYLSTKCSDLDVDSEYPLIPVETGSLLALAPQDALEPASAPLPSLDVSDVVDPPLPLVTAVINGSEPVLAPAPAETHRSTCTGLVANMGLSLLAVAMLSLLSLGYQH